MVQLWRAFGNAVPLFLLIVLLVGFVSYIILRRKETGGYRTITVNALLLLATIGILLITVYPNYYDPYAQRVINLVPFVEMYDLTFYSKSAAVPVRNLGFNILLFVPFGLFLAMRGRQMPLLKVTLLGLLFSLVIETFQFAFPMGRAADADDLILNTLGAFIGGALWKALHANALQLHRQEKQY